MKQRFVILLALALFNSGAYCQYPYYKSRFIAGASMGANIPLAKLSKGTAVDYLIDHNDNSHYYFQPTASYFFSKHLGVEVSCMVSFSHSFTSEKKFANAIAAEYNDRYVTRIFNSPSFDGPGTLNVYVGLVYRKEMGRFFIYPKLSIGVTSVESTLGWVYLKEKNTNNVFELLYNNKNNSSNPFTIAASTKVGYKLSKRLYCNIELLYSQYKSNLVYVKTMKNLYTKDSQTETISYKKDISNLNIGAGVVYVIK